MTIVKSPSRQQCGPEHEKRFLRRLWWIFPLAGLVLTSAAHRWGWYVVSLDPTLIQPGWVGGWTSVHWGIFAGFAALPLVWWFGFYLDGWLAPVYRRVPVAVLLSLLVVCCADVAVRSSVLQAPIWLSLRAMFGGKLV